LFAIVRKYPHLPYEDAGFLFSGVHECSLTSGEFGGIFWGMPPYLKTGCPHG